MVVVCENLGDFRTFVKTAGCIALQEVKRENRYTFWELYFSLLLLRCVQDERAFRVSMWNRPDAKGWSQIDDFHVKTLAMTKEELVNACDCARYFTCLRFIFRENKR